jgi:hypothetical protein
MKRRRILTSLFLLASAVGGFSQSVLFLSSSPINAQVIHNGEPLAVETPLLMRDLEPGKHTFELRKQGYRRAG